MLVGLAMLCNALFNYFLCLTTPPVRVPMQMLRPHASAAGHFRSQGRPRDIVVDMVQDQVAGAVAPEVSDPRASGQFSKTCRKCGHFKPDRAHHDSVTDECVLRFDHYCPWLFNAVGFR